MRTRSRWGVRLRRAESCRISSSAATGTSSACRVRQRGEWQCQQSASNSQIMVSLSGPCPRLASALPLDATWARTPPRRDRRTRSLRCRGIPRLHVLRLHPRPPRLIVRAPRQLVPGAPALRTQPARLPPPISLPTSGALRTLALPLVRSPLLRLMTGSAPIRATTRPAPLTSTLRRRVPLIRSAVARVPSSRRARPQAVLPPPLAGPFPRRHVVVRARASARQRPRFRFSSALASPRS